MARNKKYIYHVAYYHETSIADAFCVFGEPLDTMDMISRLRNDLAKEHECKLNEIVIISFKRIKENRV